MPRERLNPGRITALRRLLLGAAVSVLVLLVFALVAPQLATPYDLLATDAANAFEPPSWEHPLGTDQVGRDVWSRIVYGAQTSVLVGLVATLLAVLVGAAIGSATAVLPRSATYAVGRGVEALMALPEFLLALILVAIIGPGPIGVLVALSIASIPAYINVSRGATMSVRSSESVRGAKILGLAPVRIFARYVVPEAIQPVLALATLGVAVTILAASALSFLGLGVQSPTPDWGLMLAESSDYFRRAWWLVVFPGLALTLTVGALTIIGKEAQRRLR